MKNLKTIRIILAIFFLIASVAYFVAGTARIPASAVAAKVQIVPSALAVTMGATLFWLIISCLLGRVYCSTVCPAGTIQDFAIRARRFFPQLNRPFSYKKPRLTRYHVLIIYFICLIVGVLAVPYWIEPWNITRNICTVVNPQAADPTWIRLGLGVGTGIASGIISFILLVICALFTGRGFCTDICPIGTILGSLNSFTLLHIEIDPDLCISCMKCEDVCKSQCVKVSERLVDNSRCVKCFDCLEVCPNNAIRYQLNRNRRGTPLITPSN